MSTCTFCSSYELLRVPWALSAPLTINKLDALAVLRLHSSDRASCARPAQILSASSILSVKHPRGRCSWSGARPVGCAPQTAAPRRCGAGYLSNIYLIDHSP